MKKILSVSLLTLTLVGQAFASLPCAEEMAKAEAVEKAFTAWAAAHKTDSEWDDITADIMSLEPESETATFGIKSYNYTPAEALKLFNDGKLYDSFLQSLSQEQKIALRNKEMGVMESVYPPYAKAQCQMVLERRTKKIMEAASKNGKPIQLPQ